MVYRRHTNFAVESIEQTFNGTPGFGKRVSCTIARNGDLISECFLEVLVTVDNTTVGGLMNDYVYHPGEQIIDEVTLEIGGQQIDKHNRTYFRIFDELYRKDAHKLAYARLTGDDQYSFDVETPPGGQVRLYVPLIFFFNRSPGLALPLIALQYHEVKININFGSNIPGISSAPNTDLDATLFIDYIFLDTDERRRFAQTSHEYLITQVQFTGDETVQYDRNSTRTNNYRLNFNHPCKSLMWVLTDPNVHGLFNAGVKPGRVGECLNPLYEAKILLNGHDRFSTRKSPFFDRIQPYQATKTAPVTGCNLYSFALSPGEHQPSGSVNMSRIDNATLILTTKKLVAFDATGNNGGPTANVDNVAMFAAAGATENQVANTAGSLTTLRIYAENYNVLRIMSGMGGLAYSN